MNSQVLSQVLLDFDLSDLKTRTEAQGDVRFGDSELPFVIYAQSGEVDLADWINQQKNLVDTLLYRFGAIRFSGFDIGTAERLEKVVYSYSDEVLDYVERGAPRIRMGKNVFTSTEYAKEEFIPQHHEMSYSNNWPCKLFFACETPSLTKGYTPLVDDRKIYAMIPDHIKQKFKEKKVMYTRNFGLGIDMGWREAFNTDDKAQVEQYLKDTDTQFEWISDDHLRTVAIRQVVATHPVTGDEVWFNHAHLFHMSNMPEDVLEFLIEEFTAEGLPRNVFYGDGSMIEDEYIKLLGDLYRNNASTFTWQRGDMMLADNFLVAHGRSPFTGERKILVAMTDLYNSIDPANEPAA